MITENTGGGELDGRMRIDSALVDWILALSTEDCVVQRGPSLRRDLRFAVLCRTRSGVDTAFTQDRIFAPRYAPSAAQPHGYLLRNTTLTLY